MNAESGVRIRHSAFSIEMSLRDPALQERVVRTIRRERLLAPGTRVLVALSGGADSVALLHIMRDLEAAGELVLAGAAHLNHQLRGEESDADARFCEALAAGLGVPFEVGTADVRSLAQSEKLSIEAAARIARYQFLAAAADRLSADAIAAGHTRDDQAETFLLRLMRGAGARGLSGIRPKSGRVIRPLLDILRADLRGYLADRSLPFREDSSNADVAVPRNRVRHELIPFLQSRFSPAITDVLGREAALARRDDEFLRRQAIEMADRIVLTDNGSGESIRLDAGALRSVDPALGSRVAHDVLSRRSGHRFISSDHVERLLVLAACGRDGAAVSLPGQDAILQGNIIVLTAGRRRGGQTGANSFRFSLSIPGEVSSDDPQGWAIAAEPMAGDRQGQWAARGSEVGVAAARLTLPLAVRSRRPGDRFRPLGATGTRKLQDFLVDRKVPRRDRDALPLVVDGQDRIVWVVGQTVAEDFRVIDPSQGVILLRVRHLGGVG